MNKMKKIQWGFTFTMVLCLLQLGVAHSQSEKAVETHRFYEMKSFNEFVNRSLSYRADTNIDVKFYHLDLSIGIDSPHIAGRVRCQFEILSDGLQNVELDLNRALTVDSITGQSSGFSQANDRIYIQLDEPHNTGDLIDLWVHYQGVPVEAGGYKGLRYEFHHGNQPIIATLSTPYLAHYWYPCKDGPGDKADSVYVDITIEKRIYNDIELVALSNGLLENTIDHGDKKTFQWRHRYPIVTYYVMAAVSNYVMFQQNYVGLDGEEFPMDYYVFREDSASQHQALEDFPLVMDYFTELFGVYPFANEKYGMTQLGYYGAIENQTNTIINAMTVGWFRISVHELAHMWFADGITCNNWHHGWLNEGFATYSESLWKQHYHGDSAYLQHMSNMEYLDAGTLYLENASDTFHVFTPIIYNKGAYTLHMLRGVCGDSLFFEAVKSYATDSNFMYQHAVTEDLQQVFEAITNSDLDYFFEQWVYDEYYPIYHYNYSYDSDDVLRLVIQQIQGQLGRREVFTMPVPIEVYFSDGSDTTFSIWNDQELQYFDLPMEKAVDSMSLDPMKWILREAFLNPVLPVGFEEQKQQASFECYPNPFNDQLNIKCNLQDYYPLQLTLYDLNAKPVHVSEIPEVTHHTIDLEFLVPGTYIIGVKDGQGKFIYRGKIVKE